LTQEQSRKLDQREKGDIW